MRAIARMGLVGAHRMLAVIPVRKETISKQVEIAREPAICINRQCARTCNFPAWVTCWVHIFNAPIDLRLHETKAGW